MADPRPKPKAPAGLGAAGRAFWREITGTYGLDPHERRLLHEAARTVDELDRVRKALEQAPSLIAKGSMGQAVEHPLLGTLRQHRATLDKLIVRMSLPDGQGNVVTDGQRRSRAANDARWAGRRAEKAARRGA